MNGQRKILVIDDEIDVQKIIGIKFRQENFRVLFASDGEEGLKILKEEMPDLVILDIVMPNMDGYTCLKEIRNIPELKDIPVLLLSGKEEDKVKDLFTFQSISGYMEKPFELDDLVKKVKEILKI